MTGHVRAMPSPRLEVRHCVFDGDGTWYAVSTRSHTGCVVQGDTVRNYSIGLDIDGDETVVANNVIENCTQGGIYAGHAPVTVSGNIVRRCGIGVSVYGVIGASISGNVVSQARGDGIEVQCAGDVEVIGNIVSGCGGDGVKLLYDDPIVVRVAQNTSCLNGGSGYAWEQSNYPAEAYWTGNIGYSNRGYGLAWTQDAPGVVACNDWFGNGAGPVYGKIPASGDLAVDPLFCDAVGGDFRLDVRSALAESTACGLIGALGVGCAVTSTLVQRFAAERVSRGVQVVWEVAEGATAAEIWVERSEAAEDVWIRPVTERTIDNRAVVELDRSAGSGTNYWYRLVAQEGSQTVVIGEPIAVERQARLEFRLVQVSPNPGSGPLRIAFALPHPASIEIGVFDVQGRRVASLARGVWSAGTNELEWNGQTQGGEVASAGLYFLRYQYPGGQDRRAVIRIR